MNCQKLDEIRALIESGVESIWRRPVSSTTMAVELGVCRTTVFNWIRDGRIPARRVGRTYQVPRRALEMLRTCSGCSQPCMGPDSDNPSNTCQPSCQDPL